MTAIADMRAKHAEVIGLLLYAEKTSLAEKVALAKAWERDLFAECALPGREEHTQKLGTEGYQPYAGGGDRGQ